MIPSSLCRKIRRRSDWRCGKETIRLRSDSITELGVRPSEWVHADVEKANGTRSGALPSPERVVLANELTLDADLPHSERPPGFRLAGIVRFFSGCLGALSAFLAHFRAKRLSVCDNRPGSSDLARYWAFWADYHAAGCQLG